MSSDPGLTRPRAHGVEELLGVRSSKGRYYREYRHSTQDLERTLMAVNAVSWALAAAPADARRLVDSTLPVMGELLRASAVVLSCDHPGLGGPRLWTPAPGAESTPAVPGLAAELLHRAGALAEEAPPSGAVRTLPDVGCTVLLARLPAGARGAVVAALPPGQDVDRTDVAILGTLTNQLAGALESCRRLEASEALRDAADEALQRADEQAAALARRNEQLRRTRSDLLAARESQLLSEERQRIARDLHDSVAQHVLSMGMQVQWCRSAVTAPEVAERLGDITDLAGSPSSASGRRSSSSTAATSSSTGWSRPCGGSPSSTPTTG